MEMIFAEFSRTAPTSSSVKANVQPGWFAISHRWIEKKKDRRMSHARWFRLSSGNRCVFRILQFSANLGGSLSDEKGEIVIDWSAWIILSDYSDATPALLKLEITPARWWHLPWLAMAHPDPSNKLAGQIALVSFLLGAISIVLAFIV